MSTERTQHRRARNREYDAKRRAQSPARAWYASPAWKLKRKAQLKEHPECQECSKLNRTRRARIVDHVIPHRGDHKRFFHGVLQSLCTPCHSAWKQKVETMGYSSAPSSDGWPEDPEHPFNARTPIKARPPPRYPNRS